MKKKLITERIEGICFNGQGGMPNTPDVAIVISLITGKLIKIEQALTGRIRRRRIIIRRK